MPGADRVPKVSNGRGAGTAVNGSQVMGSCSRCRRQSIASAARTRPDRGYVGPDRDVGADSFRYVLVLGDRTSQAVEVDLAIYRVDVPSASPRDDFAIGSTAGGGPNSPNVSFGSLGPLAFSFEWLIPSLVVSVPGFLVVVVIGVQLLVGAAWLPLIRRDLGDFGLRFRRRRRGAARAKPGRAPAPEATPPPEAVAVAFLDAD